VSRRPYSSARFRVFVGQQKESETLGHDFELLARYRASGLGLVLEKELKAVEKAAVGL